jgi:hypothetical protein
MNLTVCRYSKYFSIAVLTGAFLLSSEMPLLASPLQSNQSNSSVQKQDDTLPDAPQVQLAQNQPPQTQPAQTPTEQPQSAQPQSQQPASVPAGAAGAQAANAKGAPVAQPAGAAVAPVRQHGHRSLLIKVGLVAAGAVAIGAVVALSKSSPSRPPGAAEAIRP